MHMPFSNASCCSVVSSRFIINTFLIKKKFFKKKKDYKWTWNELRKLVILCHVIVKMKERTVHALLHSILVINFCDFYKSFGNSVLSKIHITLKLYVHCASHQT